ncbi:rod shape-determining protein MreC [Nocardioides sp. YR527]|uniref:rod shape-determining protein MreC n=1 Tax=Nocardioides sp. YR527 TaxID=1881028 RepID=UPI00088ABB3B|nr:rod shape-determining protein MreC [Nocardioides sp. YR527]SDK81714.1 rod shape-determining protein MreC [Nocardioides sp. YR527]
MSLLSPRPSERLRKGLEQRKGPKPKVRTPRERLNRRGSLETKPGGGGPKRTWLIALILCCATLATLDQTPVLEPARAAVGEVISPLETGAALVARPFTDIPEWFDTRDDLRDRVAKLEAENSTLRRQVEVTDYGRAKLAEYESITRAAEDLGYSMVPARVTAYGPAQTFRRTVTIDAGSAAGIRSDMSVVTGDGLVGRVLRVTKTSATVLLIVDAASVVGGRVGGEDRSGKKSGQVGMVRGSGVVAGSGLLTLDLVDRSTAPLKGDTVITWGDGRAAPYVSGLPIGEVTDSFESVRDSSQTARIKPYVDFGSLDVVGVVVPGGTMSDRAVITPEGELR